MKNSFNQKFVTHQRGSVRNLLNEIKGCENNMNEQTFYFRKYLADDVGKALEYIESKDYKYTIENESIRIKFT